MNDDDKKKTIHALESGYADEVSRLYAVLCTKVDEGDDLAESMQGFTNSMNIALGLKNDLIAALGSNSVAEMGSA